MRVKNYDSIVQAMEALKQKGYEENLQFVEGRLKNTKTGQWYQPEDLIIDEYHRFEGLSNPSDMSVLFAISCSDGTKGLVSSAYGAYGDRDFMEFMDQISENSE